MSDPRNASNDRFVLSKGHAAPILYAAWAEAGLFPKEDLVFIWIIALIAPVKDQEQL